MGWIWGASRYGRCIGHGASRWRGRAHSYVSDPWHAQAGVQMSNVWYKDLNGKIAYRWRYKYSWAYRYRYKYVTKFYYKKTGKTTKPKRKNCRSVKYRWNE